MTETTFSRLVVTFDFTLQFFPKKRHKNCDENLKQSAAVEFVLFFFFEKKRISVFFVSALF